MTQAIILASAIGPAALLLWYFHSRDRFPEPTPIVIRTAAWGCFATLPAIGIGLVLEPIGQRLGDPIAAAAFGAFVQAGLVEELCKLAVLLGYAMRHSAFDEPMDGLVYGAAAALGFAGLENLLYVQSAEGDWAEIAMIRGLTAVPQHAIDGAMMGFFCGLAHFDPTHRAAHLWKAWLVPATFHGLYDWPLFVLQARGEVEDPASPMVVAWLAVLGGGALYARHLLKRVRHSQHAQAVSA
ncbi:MAG: PrsW family intramembrane metalloprotease [Alphaproteobacteria bacterium]|nr:PrsW family intramembrane metalloprotease [Alphaproteobacteria bacterium]